MTLTAKAAAPTSLCAAPVATTGSHCVARVPRLEGASRYARVSRLERTGVKWHGNPPSPVGDATRTGDATHSRYRYANTSRLRRETRLQRWIHRNALASLCLERFVIP
ncbi:MAG: hypothetical protein V7L04_24115 [Nostoc sp.]|uniref:hypothetical protein n=1 Tax=Nostoc sp. TaxID=1180 RepID=UPI002FF56FF6